MRKLREAEVELSKGSTVKDACRNLGVTEHTYYSWRREYGALKLNQAKRPHTRSDNGPESTAQCDRMRELGVNTLFIEPGSPWENGYVESFNGRLRDELLDGEIF